jgi:hypothetical protein
MISPNNRVSVVCAGGKLGGCRKAASSFTYDIARYAAGNVPNAEEHKKLYVREVHKKLEQKAKKEGFLKIEIGTPLTQIIGVQQNELEMALLNYNEQQIYNWQNAHICINCIRKQLTSMENYKQHIVAFETKQKKKIVKKNKTVKTNNVIT